jgi:ERCC4-type nuclease
MEEEFVEVPYTVIVDTREQAPFTFLNMPAYKQDLPSDKKDRKGILLVDVKKVALKTGDYSIEGMEDEVAVERKSLEDLFNCVGNDRTRFEKQLERLSQLKRACIMVEGDWNAVIGGVKHSELTGKHILSSVIAWQQDYFPTIHWWFPSTKLTAERFTFRILDRYWKKNKP